MRRLVLFVQKIRRIKANLGDCDDYMKMPNLDFPIIGVTETWLNDDTCDFMVWVFMS